MVAQDKDDLARFARRKCKVDLMRPHRCPAVCDRIVQRAALDGLRRVPATVGAEECLALCLEGDRRLRAGEVGEVIAPLSVLGLVVDDALHHFHFADVEVALEVGCVVLCIPERELDGGEEVQRRGRVAVIGDGRLPHF